MLVCEMMALQNSVAVFKFFLMSVRWPLVFLTPLSVLNFFSQDYTFNDVIVSYHQFK